MKKHNKFVVFVCLFLWVFTANAQNKAVASKFDEFTSSSDDSFYPYEQIKLSDRIERFIKQIKKERAIKVYIIYYQPRVLYKNEEYQIRNWASHTKFEISQKTKLEDENIFVIDGGVKEDRTLQYWIVPQNAEPPNPTPSFDESESYICPKVYVFGDALEYDKTKLVEFSVPLYDMNHREVSFEWKVSIGEIVEGEGTEKIKIKINDSEIKRITAFVKAVGLPFPCETNAFSTIEIGNKPYMFDRAERYNFSDLAARIDNFMVMLLNNPTSKGYIIVYADRNRGTQDMERGIKSVQNYVRFRNFDQNRITIVKGGFREDNTVDSWILPEGAEPPIPMPTVDKKFVTLPVKAKQKNIRKRK